MMTASIAMTFILTALWQSALIAAISWAAIRAFSIHDAASRTSMWSMAFFLATITPFVIFVPSVETAIDETAVQAYFTGLPAPAAVAASGNISNELDVFDLWRFVAPTIIIVWILGAFWRLGLLVRDITAMTRLRNESVLLAGDPFDLSNNVDLYLNMTLSSPLATGVFRPAIILPTDLYERGGQTLQGALAHERAHIVRGDLVANFVEVLVLSLFWWNPALLLVRREISTSREMACDDLAVGRTESTRSYASALIACAESAATRAAPLRASMLSATGSASELTRRIERMTDNNYMPQRRTTLLRSLLTFTAIAAATAGAAVAAPRVSAKAIVDLSPYEQAAPRSKAEALGRDLVVAVLEQNIIEAEQLLAKGADINAVLERDGTPLIAAVNDDNYEIVSWLLESGADINAYAVYDETALISAVRNSTYDMVSLLIDRGANINLLAKTETGVVRSPLGEARRLKRWDVERLLVGAGAAQ